MSPRQSAAVYRRRRIVALAIVIMVLALLITLVWSLVARGGSGPTPNTSASASAKAAKAAKATASPSSQTPPASPAPATGPAPCTAAAVQVTAVTDRDSYAADQNPQLSISLTNTSAKDCTMNVGTTQQTFTITSGSDTWWRSTDCQQKPSDSIQTIRAGATITSSTPVVWDRTRSRVETCGAADRERAPGGGAAYRLAVSIGGFKSTNMLQFLLE